MIVSRILFLNIPPQIYIITQLSASRCGTPRISCSIKKSRLGLKKTFCSFVLLRKCHDRSSCRLMSFLLLGCPQRTSECVPSFKRDPRHLPWSLVLLYNPMVNPGCKVTTYFLQALSGWSIGAHTLIHLTVISFRPLSYAMIRESTSTSRSI